MSDTPFTDNIAEKRAEIAELEALLIANRKMPPRHKRPYTARGLRDLALQHGLVYAEPTKGEV